MDKILYVTSFSKPLYEATGKAMVESFVLREVQGDLLITYEGDISPPNNKKFIKHNLETNTFLSDWLEENRDIIPIEYGGDATPEENKTLWNRRASLWFRKIIALREALKFKDDYKAIVFCDCDCEFLNKIPASLILESFKGNDFFYHKGRRPAIESGFMGFNLEKNGEQFINLIFECFSSKDFRKYDRWDDGYVITQVLKESKDISGRDVVRLPKESWQSRHIRSHVVPFGPFADYLRHDKGVHTNVHGIFKNDKKK